MRSIRNRGDGTFEDVPIAPGLRACATTRPRRPSPISTTTATSTFTSVTTWSGTRITRGLCLNDKREYFYCDPSKVPPAPDHVFRNDGGRFVDVTESSGCKEIARARAGRRRGRSRRRRPHRPLRRQRRHGQLPVSQPGGLPLRGNRPPGRRGRQRRGRLPGGHGRGLRRPRRRRPSRADGHQLLRRGHDPLSEPGRGPLRRSKRRFRNRAGHAATCSASASRWPTSTTTACSTS